MCGRPKLGSKEGPLKISLYATLAFAAATFLAGLTVGWVLTGQAGWSLVGLNGEGSGGTPAHEAAHTVEEPPPAVAPEMPSEDVPGGDVPGLPRYPGSVRVEHIREDLGDVVATEVEYLTPAEIDDVQDSYRGVLRTGGWYVGDVGFSRGAWTFFVIRDEREAFIEIKPRGGGLVEIDMEITDAQAKEGGSGADGPSPDGPSPNKSPGQLRRPAPVQQPSGPVYDEEADDYDEGGDD